MNENFSLLEVKNQRLNHVIQFYEVKLLGFTAYDLTVLVWSHWSCFQKQHATIINKRALMDPLHAALHTLNLRETYQ